MALYKVILHKQVRKKDIPLIPAKDRVRIVKRITHLATDPYAPDSVQLKGRQERRIRQGNYRILYVVKVKIVTFFIVKIGHRREIYR